MNRDEVQVLEEVTRREAELAVHQGCFETQLQREAAILVEQLRILACEVTYAHDRLKGKILRRLADGELWCAHPGMYRSLDELLISEEIGISKSEASDLLAWEKVIYPWFQEKKGLSAWETWQLLPKTKWRRIIRVLRALIDPEYHSPSENVRLSVELLMKDCQSPEEAVDKLIDLAQNAPTTRDLEGVIYPNEIPSIVITVRQDENGVYHGRFVASHDQLQVLKSYRKVEVMYEH